jgi:thymidylate synthase
MTKEIENALQECWAEYENFLRAGAYYSAVLRLAEIFNCLPRMNKKAKERWGKRVDREPLAIDVIKNAVASLKANAQRIRQVLSIGDTWNEDEILLILLTRTQIDILSRFLTQKASEIDVALDDIDEMINQMAQSNQNRRNYVLTVRQMRENSRLPTDSKWLQTIPERKKNE